MENEKEESWHHYSDAMSSSARPAQQDDNEEALRLLDGAIAKAISENENRWVLTLTHHAVVISNFLGNLALAKRYYEKSLEFNPENPRALEGLADVAQEQGELELAKEYASRCYTALIAGGRTAVYSGHLRRRAPFLRDWRLESVLGQRISTIFPCSKTMVCSLASESPRRTVRF